MSGCICDQKCPVTDDKHWVDCPAHERYAEYLKMTANTPDGTLVPVEQGRERAIAVLRAEENDFYWAAEYGRPYDYGALIDKIAAALASSPAPIPVSGEVERHALVLLAQFDKFRESDLNHECAHRYLARYELWEDLRAALNHTPTSDQGEARALIHDAYVQGATDVHSEWMREGELPRTECPEFGEAADDYVASITALNHTPTSGQGEARARGARTFTRVGKQILANGQHYADGADEAVAELILAALLAY